MKIFAFFFTFIFSQAVFATFCDWSSSAKVFAIESELARLGKFEGDPILRTTNLNLIRNTPQYTEHLTDLPTKVIGGTGQRTEMTTSIRPDNVKELFQENLPDKLSGQLGAKALAVTDADGKVKVVFWKTAEGGSPTQVHHRDVAAGVLKTRADNLTEEANAIAAVDPARANFLKAEADKIRAHAQQIGGPGSIRSHDVMSYSVMEEMQGFKLSTTLRGRNQMVTRLEVDSAITGAQMSRNAPIDVNRLAQQIIAVVNSISPSVRSYDSILIKKNLFEKIGEELPQLQKILRDNGINLPLRAS